MSVAPIIDGFNLLNRVWIRGNDKGGGIGENFWSSLELFPRTFVCRMRCLVENLPAHDRSNAVLRNAHTNAAPQHPNVMFALRGYVFHIRAISEKMTARRA